MKINVIYDASVADAPAGFKSAVEAAVAFYERSYSDPITVNITFGYGEVGGQALPSAAIGASFPSAGYGLTYAELRAALGASATSMDDVAAALALPTSDITKGGLFYVPPAEAKALGLLDPASTAADGHVGLNDSLGFFFDQTNPQADAYDAVAVLEHEIGHVLGRLSGLGGQGEDGVHQFAALDLFRYSAAGVHNPTGNGWFSVDGQALLHQFNDPRNGADSDDWQDGNPLDAFNAFGTPGVRQSLSSEDLKLYDVLGYARPELLSPSLQAAGASTSARLVLSSAYTLPASSPLYIKNAAAGADAYLQIAAPAGQPGPAFILQGSLSMVSEAAGDLRAVSVVGSGTSETKVYVQHGLLAHTLMGDALGVAVSGSAFLSLGGTVEVVSDVAEAIGVEAQGPSTRVSNAGDLRVFGIGGATGFVGGQVNNTGNTTVVVGADAAGHATAVGALDPTILLNQGQLKVIGQVDDAVTIGVEITQARTATYSNFGVIQAHYAFLQDLAGGPTAGFTSLISNFGTIIGSMVLTDLQAGITNTGVLAGNIYLSGFSNTFNGAGGKFIGDLYLGAGTSSVTLGSDGESVVDGGGSATITGGGGVDTVSFEFRSSGMSVDLSKTTAQTIGGSSVWTLNAIENLTGGAGSDKFTGSAGANFLFDRTGGDDVFAGGGGNDVLTVFRSASAAASTVSLDGGDGADQLIFSGGDRYTDTVALVGGSGDDTLFASGAKAVRIDAGLGADTIGIDAARGDYTITTGWIGADVISLQDSTGEFGKAKIVITDFQTGDSGDRLALDAYLQSALPDLPIGADPFGAGYAKLVQSGYDTLLQVRQTLDAAFTTLVTLSMVKATELTGYNLGGYLSNLNSSAATKGTNSADVLTGTSHNDYILALDGNDTLKASPGSDYMDGGAGVDTAIYAGLSRAYALSFSPFSQAVVGGPEGGADRLISVERLQFVDGYYSFGATDTAGKVVRLYVAALARGPDSQGLANWTHNLDAGGTLKTIANGFIDSPEFLSRFGAGDDKAFVTLLYNNILGRDPDAEGLASWLGYMHAGSGQSRADVLLGFSESPEFIDATIGFMQQGLWIGDDKAAQVARLYDTVFGRLPDGAGETGWTLALKSGQSLNQVAQGFVNSTEFKSIYGALNDDAFVQLMYQNVLHRPAEPDGLAGWKNYLAAGHSRAEVVVGFSESAEHVHNTAPHIQDGVWFG